MVDFKKLDLFFVFFSLQKAKRKKEKAANRRQRRMRLVKLLLPAVAAALAGLLVLLPGLSDKNGEFQLKISRPKDGELEKLHMENTVFYITDDNNRVNSLIADTIDETEPGSKLIKLIRPEGLLPTADDLWVSIKAPVGYFDQRKNLLWLEQTVNMVYSDGMTAVTEKMYYDGNKAKAYADTPVKADGYFGNLEAEGFEYYKDKKMMVFTGKSKIVIKQDNGGEKQ